MADGGDDDNDDDDATGRSLFALKLVSQMSCTVSTCLFEKNMFYPASIRGFVRLCEA